jgi:hypothetical protein
MNARMTLVLGILSISASAAPPQTATPVANPPAKSFLPSLIVSLQSVPLVTPPTVTKGWYMDADGDGRIDGAELRFPEPFPFGVTSVMNSQVSGHVYYQSGLSLSDAVFAMEDSVPPVILGAAIKEKSADHPYDRVSFSVSEPVTLPLASNTCLVFKRGAAEVPPAQARISRIEKTGDRDYMIFLDEGSPYAPATGDSIAIDTTGEAEDTLGNRPARRCYIALEDGSPAATHAPASKRGGSAFKVRDGLLVGNWPVTEAPLGIECFDLKGVRLGSAGPAPMRNAWLLPPARQSMLLLFRMKDGLRRSYLIRP